MALKHVFPVMTRTLLTPKHTHTHTHTRAVGGGLTICCGAAEQNKTSRREIQKREKMKKQSHGQERQTEERRVNGERRDCSYPEGCLTLTIYLHTQINDCLSLSPPSYRNKPQRERQARTHTQNNSKKRERETDGKSDRCRRDGQSC